MVDKHIKKIGHDCDKKCRASPKNDESPHRFKA